MTQLQNYLEKRIENLKSEVKTDKEMLIEAIEALNKEQENEDED